MTITFNKELFDTMGNQQVYTIDILKYGVKVGRVDMIVDTEDERNNYLEWIEIDNEFRGQGIGSEVFHMLAKEYGYIFFAPCDERNKEMYERIAEEMTGNVPEVDQGFGVYFMEA